MRYFVVLAVALGLSAPALPALAEGLVLHKGSSNSRNSLFRNQTSLLDTRLSSQYSTATRLKPKTAIEATIGGESGGNLRYSGRYKGEYLPVAKSIAAKHGVPEDLFLRLVQQESGWNPNAVSNKGAMGLAQLMPGTAAKLGVNPRDPHQNLEGGARYLLTLIEGTLMLAAIGHAAAARGGRARPAPATDRRRPYPAQTLYRSRPAGDDRNPQSACGLAASVGRGA